MHESNTWKRHRRAGVALGLLLVVAGCARSTLVATPPAAASPGHRLVLLPPDFILFRDGGRYDPASTAAETRGAVTALAAAFVAEARAAGAEVVGQLTWSGRLVSPDGRALGTVASSDRVVATMRSVLAGGAVTPDVAEVLAGRYGATAAVLLTGNGSRTTTGKRAAQIAAATALTMLVVGAVALTAWVVAGGSVAVGVPEIHGPRGLHRRGRADGVALVGPPAAGFGAEHAGPSRDALAGGLRVGGGGAGATAAAAAAATASGAATALSATAASATAASATAASAAAASAAAASGTAAVGALLVHVVPPGGLRLVWNVDAGTPLVDPAGLLGPAHVHGDGCAPAAGIHDGVAPVPAEGREYGFWRGSRIDLTLALVPLPAGPVAWSAHAERRADAHHPAALRRLLRALLRA
jgi:hypothetical protein